MVMRGLWVIGLGGLGLWVWLAADAGQRDEGHAVLAPVEVPSDEKGRRDWSAPAARLRQEAEPLAIQDASAVQDGGELAELRTRVADLEDEVEDLRLQLESARQELLHGQLEPQVQTMLQGDFPGLFDGVPLSTGVRDRFFMVIERLAADLAASDLGELRATTLTDGQIRGIGEALIDEWLQVTSMPCLRTRPETAGFVTDVVQSTWHGDKRAEVVLAAGLTAKDPWVQDVAARMAQVEMTVGHRIEGLLGHVFQDPWW